MKNQLSRISNTHFVEPITDVVKARRNTSSAKKRPRRNTLNTPKLIEIPPYPLPQGYVWEKPKLIVDMISLTFDVASASEREAICERIKNFKDHRVVKRYTPNYCRTNYHNTFQFNVQPKRGEAFTLKVSDSPIDGHRENAKRRFLRVEFNPATVGKKRMWILRKVLCRLLGAAVVGRLYTDGMVTRVDFALDFEGLLEPLYLHKTTARASSIFHGQSSATQYVGGKRSRVRLRWYDKACEAAARGRESGEKTWYRLEAKMTDLRCSPEELGRTLHNPFQRLRFYSANFLEDSFSGNKRLEQRFRRSVREHGLNATFEADPRWRAAKRRYLKWLEDRGHRRHLFDAGDVWAQMSTALAVLDELWECSETAT